MEIKGFFIYVASRKGEVEVFLKISLSLCHHMQSQTVLAKRKKMFSLFYQDQDLLLVHGSI